jgi:hypothetical protein
MNQKKDGGTEGLLNGMPLCANVEGYTFASQNNISFGWMMIVKAYPIP